MFLVKILSHICTLCCLFLLLAPGMLTPFLTFSQVKELDLGHREKPDYFNVKATITYANSEKCLYMACANTDCNKKVTEGSTGDYFCEKCNQSSPDFKYRMILSVS